MADTEELIQEEDKKSDKPKKPSTAAVILIIIFTILIIAFGVAFIKYAKKLCDDHARAVLQSQSQQTNKPDKTY